MDKRLFDATAKDKIVAYLRTKSGVAGNIGIRNAVLTETSILKVFSPSPISKFELQQYLKAIHRDGFIKPVKVTSEGGWTYNYCNESEDFVRNNGYQGELERIRTKKITPVTKKVRISSPEIEPNPIISTPIKESWIKKNLLVIILGVFGGIILPLLMYYDVLPNRKASSLTPTEINTVFDTLRTETDTTRISTDSTSNGN